jgi:hypothetical protein
MALFVANEASRAGENGRIIGSMLPGAAPDVSMTPSTSLQVNYAERLRI